MQPPNAPAPAPRLEALSFTADRGDARLTLQAVLVRRVRQVSGLSLTLAREWIVAGAVQVAGAVAGDPDGAVARGAVVEVTLPPGTRLRRRPTAEPGPLQVLYEDEALLILDKPAGLVVHPSYKHPGGTLFNHVLWHLRHRESQPGILTRLDKQTSGVVVVALTAGVQAALQRQAAAGRFTKDYLAVVQGRPDPPSGIIDAPLGRDPSDRRRVMVMPDGAPSRTSFTLLVSDGSVSLMRCTPMTGRTHQIRVHLASCGWPILGDAAYGVPDARLARQALHAWRVTFDHPVTGKPIEITAPPPADVVSLGLHPRPHPAAPR